MVFHVFIASIGINALSFGLLCDFAYTINFQLLRSRGFSCKIMVFHSFILERFWHSLCVFNIAIEYNSIQTFKKRYFT